MGHVRTDSKKKYHYASLICDYFLKNNLTHGEITARDIAKYHHLKGESYRSISAFLNYLYSNCIRKADFGFYIVGTQPLSKCEYPHKFRIELIDGAKGLL